MRFLTKAQEKQAQRGLVGRRVTVLGRYKRTVTRVRPFVGGYFVRVDRPVKGYTLWVWDQIKFIRKDYK